MKNGFLILLVFLLGCTTLTPDRIQVLAMIAGQAAQVGAQEWLVKHPEHRAAFNLVMVAINNFVRSGETNMAKYTALLESLPTSTLRGEAGEVYIAGEPAENELGPKAAAHLVIWDNELKKAVKVTGELERPVQRAIRDGLRRACAPQPPPLPGKSRLPGIVPEGALPRFQPALWPPTPEYHGPNWQIHANDLLLRYSNTIPVQFNSNRFPQAAPLVIIPESAEPPSKTDAELDAEFEAIKAGLKKRK